MLLACFSASVAALAEDVVEIGDAALRRCVEQALDKAAGETITNSDMASLTYLGCYAGELSNLAGLEFGTSLTDLRIYADDISDLSPLAGLESLTNLELEFNSISDISPLSGLTSLNYLTIGPSRTKAEREVNPIDDISALSNLTSLNVLLLFWTHVADVSPLRDLTALNNVYLVDNRICDIGPLAQNVGLVAPDLVSLDGNPLGAAAHDTHIPTLQGRGVSVYFDPPTEAPAACSSVEDEEEAPAAAPANLRAVVGDGQLTFHWDAVADATGYHYRIKAGTAEWGAWTSVAGDATSHTAENLANGTAYWFQVRAMRGDEAGPASVEISATPTPLEDEEEAPAAAPANLRAVVGDGQLTFHWDAVADATGYHYRIKAGTAEWGAWTSVAGDATSHTAENLANGTAYWFQVRAANGGGTGPASVEISATPAAEDFVEIGDAALRHCVERALGKGAGEAISQKELTTLTSLSCRNAGVSNLSGIDAATSLAELDLRDNAVADIAALAANTGLGSGDTVDLRGNPLNAAAHGTHIPALRNRGASVYFDKPAASPPVDIPDAALRRCVEQALDKAAGETITNSDMASLTYLECYAGELSNLAGLEFGTSLTDLRIYADDISDLSPLAGLESLTSLILEFNSISDISPLSGLTSLNHLTILPSRTKAEREVNPIDDISALSNLTSLYVLLLDWTHVADVSPLRDLTALANVSLVDNRICDIGPLAQNVGLAAPDLVHLRGNPLGAAAHDTHIPTLQGRGVTVHFDPPTEAPAACSAADEDLVEIGDAALRHCVERALGKGAGQTISETEMATLSELSCDARYDDEIPDRPRLDPVHNPHGTVSDLAGLEFAVNLSSLELRGNESLFDLSPLADLSSLTRLGLSNNDIADLSPLAGLASLTHLLLVDNAVTDLSPLARLASLRRLLLSGNAVLDLSPLSRLTSLTHLLLVDNAVTDLSPLGGLASLETLHLGSNAISDLSPLAGLTSLTDLSLHRNLVADISGLAKLVSLDSLNLTGNFIVDVSALRGLEALTSLALSSNRISDISPLVDNTGLGAGWLYPDYVNLRSNRIPCGTNARGVHALRSRGASVFADAVRIGAPAQVTATAGDETVQLSWLAPAGCHVVRYEVRYGIGESPDFGPWDAVEAVENGAMNYTVDSLINGRRYAFEVRAIGSDSAGLVRRTEVALAEDPVGPVAIVDERLSAGIAQALGKATRPSQPGRPFASSQSSASEVVITQEDMATLTDLDLRGMDIADLTGLEYALNLRRLLLSGNRVTSLDAIEGLQFLSALDLSANGLSDISSLSRLHALERLWLNDNEIADIWPLAVNMELGAGEVRSHGSSDYVDLRGNPLNRGATQQHVPSLRERGAAVLVDDPAHLLPVFAAAGNRWRQSFARIVNPTDRHGEVGVTAIDESGNRLGPLTLPVGAGKTVHFNSSDLENGNAEMGMHSGVGAGAGAWRLELRSSLPIEVFAYMRHADGLVTSMTALAPEAYAQHRIPTFNPGSNGRQTSRLRVINPTDKVARVLLEGVDDGGTAASAAVTVPAGGAREFTAAALEQGVGPGIVDGGLGDGVGKWRLTATSYDGVHVLSVLDNPAGHRANLSTEPSGSGGVHHLPLFPSAASPGREGFVRVVNQSPRAGSVRVRAFDSDGNAAPAGTLALPAHGAVHFNSRQLEQGNAKGLTGLAVAQGDWRLQLHSDLDLGVYGYVRTTSGFVDSIHETAPVTGTGAHRIVFFNPARNTRQASWLRVVNMGDTPANVRITGTDDDGTPAADPVRLTIPANATRDLTAEDLETGGADGVAGALAEGSGKWRLLVESDGVLAVLSLLQDDAGRLTNLSR